MPRMSIDGVKEGTLIKPLSDQEKKKLAMAEQAIVKGLRAYVVIGRALKAIKDGNLHRATHANFEDYLLRPEKVLWLSGRVVAHGWAWAG